MIPIQETCPEVSEREVEARFEPRQEGSGVQAFNYQVIFFFYFHSMLRKYNDS